MLPWHLLLLLLHLASSLAEQFLYDLVEESLPNHVVAQLAKDIMANTYHMVALDNEPDLARLNLKLASSDVFGSFFKIEKGQLLVRAPLDRELACPHFQITDRLSSDYSYQFSKAQQELSDQNLVLGSIGSIHECKINLTVHYNTRFASQESTDYDPMVITVVLRLLDINNKAPRFTSPIAVPFKMLGEVTAKPVETWFQLPTAHDPDAGENGTLVYSIEPPVDQKSLFPFKLEGNPLRLVLQHPLDYEVAKKYEVKLHVSDRGVPNQMHNTANIVIHVLDENDHVPKFEKAVYQLRIMETAGENETILKISIIDEDEGNNGKVITDGTHAVLLRKSLSRCCFLAIDH
ncbi:putative calcium-dependent cell-adhesion protein [Cichlidogyrus casuarinus]|uniref:Calcium-dependent cell-adhesion protein n=1 Tax=Cichlidogyrus casuarinus TaxID=1844966 RepID=A0ABD2PQ35_9PLAT